MSRVPILAAFGMAGLVFIGCKTESKPVEKAAQKTMAPSKKEPPSASRKETVPAPADVAAPPADATRTQSGLAIQVLKPGTGTDHPTADSVVKVNYTGWTTDGKMFDSSALHGGSANIALDRGIPGWTEGVQLMTKGEKVRFWIPEDLAYKGRPGAPQGMLVFNVKLLNFSN